MRSNPVVAVEPAGQLGGAVGRGWVGLNVDPLPQAGLDEALSLAVGLRRMGSGPEMLEPQPVHRLAVAEGWKLEPLSVMTRGTLTPRV
jgi:hypothetical protein